MGGRIGSGFRERESVLQRIDDHLWIAEDPLKLFGIDLGRRMTVIGLPDGGLFVHSPWEMTAERKRRLLELGHVRFIVASAGFHDLYLDQALAAFPQGEFHAIPSLFRRFSSRLKTFPLSDRAVSPWGEAIEQHVFWAGPFHSETVFFHRESRSLLLADLCFRLEDGGLLARFLGGGFGVYRRFSPTRDIRLWTLGQRRRLRASVDYVLEWPFTRIVPAHGELVLENGRTVFEAAFRWVRRKT
ncbi:MAG: DUF4336 domain-containing protein [Nitrospirae bacterium]|jgi:hypothetical protein|nr:DUF4336 domain-containing protein [Nitrospirota bacterium]